MKRIQCLKTQLPRPYLRPTYTERTKPNATFVRTYFCSSPTFATRSSPRDAAKCKQVSPKSFAESISTPPAIIPSSPARSSSTVQLHIVFCIRISRKIYLTPELGDGECVEGNHNARSLLLAGKLGRGMHRITSTSTGNGER